ncbi:CLUMA_CG020560, isoform A [Clunio marinus]|uniref:CLUMA_CG020560, isoform A n=1 Tax=Clunio marinus TaxID=568069 RepID=A0A1J1J5A9_9DIPT|nr:CLUMA_CG020560, isoform A [Clunio marinus]
MKNWFSKQQSNFIHCAASRKFFLERREKKSKEPQPAKTERDKKNWLKVAVKEKSNDKTKSHNEA